MTLKKVIVVFAFLLMAFGSGFSLYQNLRWDCWQPGGGEIKNGGWYPFMSCHSRWRGWLCP